MDDEEIQLVDVTFNVFQIFNAIQTLFDEDILLEISVRQSQISLILDDDIIPLSSFCQKDWFEVSENPYLAIAEDNPVIILLFKENYSPVISQNPLINLKKLITEISERVCKCPALEIVFSNQYLKCYLDKPGLTINDLKEYENIFDMQGTLELHGQRPYLLFINENISAGDLIDNDG